MNRIFILLGAATVVLAALAWFMLRSRPTEPEAEPQFNHSINYSYFEVKGTNTGAIEFDVMAKSSWTSGGELAFDPARWRPDVFIRGVDTRKGCVPGPFEVKLSITISLPKWAPPEHADPSFVAWWNAKAATIKAHYNGHAKIATDAAQEVFDTLKTLPPRPDCESLRADANQATDAILQRSAAKQIAYDATTDHGRNQLAWHPQ